MGEQPSFDQRKRKAEAERDQRAELYGGDDSSSDDEYCSPQANAMQNQLFDLCAVMDECDFSPELAEEQADILCAMEMECEAAPEPEPVSESRFSSLKRKAKKKRKSPPRLYKALEATKEYQETGYLNKKFEEKTDNLTPLNKFWCSFAKYALSRDSGSNGAFLSDYVVFPTSSINEMLLALSVLDLPFVNETPSYIFGGESGDDASLRLVAKGATIVFVKELSETASTETSKISIHIHYFDANDKYTTDGDGERSDKFVEVFQPGKIYGCQSVLTNVSSMTQKVEILSQIPTGSIAVDNGFRTRTVFVNLNAYSTDSRTFYFYFPTVGRFRHFPVTVSKKGKMLGAASVMDSLLVEMAAKDRPIDVESWTDVSINADDATVLKYLQTHNCHKLDLSRILFRIGKSETFFNQLCDILEATLIYNRQIYGYAFKYGSLKQLQMYLSNTRRFANATMAPRFYSKWISYDQLHDNGYAHLEYIPLVNSRAHLLGAKRKIQNDKFSRHYLRFLERVSFGSTSVADMNGGDTLAAIYYLLLQDRTQESMEMFSLLSSDNSADNNILVDYLRAYMALFDESDASNAIEVATNIAAKYRNADSLPKALRKLFEDIESELLSDLGDYKRESGDNDAVIHGLGDRDRVTTALADATPSLDFEVTSSKIVISYANLSQCVVNFYRMNTEVLFSMSPFIGSGGGNSGGNDNKSTFSYIAPNHSMKVSLPKGDVNNNGAAMSSHSFDIPKALQHLNLFVNVVSDTLNVSRAVYAQKLLVSLKENYGQLQVLSKDSLKPMKKAYVKVYAKTGVAASAHEFYKDGYTDIRGKFDYASISTDQLQRANKFAILVVSDECGCLVRECKPPKQ